MPLNDLTADPRSISDDYSKDFELKKVIENLRVHQLELESQNDALRQTQAKLQSARDRYADLYDFAPVGYITIDKETRIVEANLTTAIMLGENRDQLPGRLLTSFIDRKCQDDFFRSFHTCPQAENGVISELILRGKDGKSLPVRLEGNIVRPDDFQSEKSSNIQEQAHSQARTLKPHCLIIISDISKRRAAETALHQAQNLWKRTFEVISDPVIIIDSQMKIIQANKASHHLLNDEPGDLSGKLCFSLFRNKDHICSNCPVKNVLETGVPGSLEFSTGPNQEKTFHVTVSPFPDDTGKITKVILAARDITRIKALKKQLLQAQKLEAIGTLAGGIAHDFNNILTAIIGYAKLGLLNLPENTNKGDCPAPIRHTKQRNYLTKIFNAGNRAGQLVSQILTFSRRHDIVLTPMDSAPIIRESIKFLRASLPSTISIVQSIPHKSPMILADPTQIHQVILNLSTNAAHAMKKSGGTLQISMKKRSLTGLPGDNNKTEQGLKPGQYLELRVSDTGEGMNQNQLSQIFDPFYTTKKKGEGTGLGLSVVHGIVTKTGGNIAVKSSPGQGTTFTLLLPEVEKSTPRQSASDDSIDLPTGTERILMVDDEITLLEMTKEYLTLLGYQLISCSDSRNALDIFHKQPDFFDLVITDQTMPDIPGDQLVGEILKIRPDIPIILNTGYSESINEDKARAIGIRTYLLKPVPMETLAATIRCVLDTPEGQLSVRGKRMAAALC